MGWSTFEQTDIGFVSGAMPDDPVELRGMVGRERISRLFEFDVLLIRPKNPPFTESELDALLGAPCTVAMGKTKNDLVFGILQNIEVLEARKDEPPIYHARMVPRVWLLTQTHTNRIFQNMTIAKVVEEVLTKYGLSPGQDFEIHGGEAKREYIVQYEESDWAFIQRWLEREGMYYWFRHDAEKKRDVLVIGSKNADNKPIFGDATILPRGQNNLVAPEEATIWDFQEKISRNAARVALLDYNDETPLAFIAGKADVDEKKEVYKNLGFGTVFSWGEHLADQGEADRLSKLRAEHLFAQRQIFSGTTSCSRFRPGFTFEFERPGGEQKQYLITAVEHQVGVPLHVAGTKPLHYNSKFEAILTSVQYRPPRTTPWPRIHGVISGHIEEDTDGKYAQIDAHGRYKVRIPFDLSGKQGSAVSRWIRLAEPYSGAGYGTHFPLHKGAEVLVAHIAGDPDRPIIVGAVPNPATKSPSVDANATQSVIRTPSGIFIEMEDLQG